MLALALSCAFALGAAPDVWTASPLTVVRETTEEPEIPESAFRLYAARGEYEAFQVAVRNTGNEPLAIVLEDGRVSALGISPRVFRVGNVLMPGTAPAGAMEMLPDPLIPTRRALVPPESTTVFWVRYHIPREARAGIHQGTFRVRYGKRERPIAVTLEVFRFQLPESPALSVYLPLEHGSLVGILPLTSSTAEALRPVYRTLADYPFAYGGWAGATVGEDGPQATLSAMLRYGSMPIVDIGPGPLVGPAFLLESAPDSSLDPDAIRTLREWAITNSERGRLIAGVGIAPPSQRLEFLRQRLISLGSDVAVERLAAAPLDPLFEDHLEIWGIPDSAYNPAASALLEAGRSLAFPQTESGHATATSEWDGRRAAAKAFDGSLFTSWSPRENARRRSERLTVTFENPVRLEVVRVAWPFDGAPPIPTLETSTRPGYFAPADAEWQRFEAVDAYAFGWFEATLDVPKSVLAISLEFVRTRNTAEYAVSEITVGETPEYGPLAPGIPPELWLTLAPGEYPTTAPGASRVPLRTVGWVAWSRGMGGLIGRGAANWPDRWTAPESLDGAPWPPLADYGDILFYPWRNRVLPSIRAEILRDAVEDVAYAEAFRAGAGLSPETRASLTLDLRPLDPGPRPDGRRLQALWEHIYGARLAFGRAASSD